MKKKKQLVMKIKLTDKDIQHLALEITRGKVRDEEEWILFINMISSGSISE